MSYKQRRTTRPEEEARRAANKAKRRGSGGQKKKSRAKPAQLDHAQSADARRHAREGEKRMKRERGQDDE